MRKILLEVDAESVFHRDVPGMGGDIGRRAGFGGLDHLVAVDPHVGEVGVGKQADHAGFFRDHAMPQFKFVVFRVDLPRLPHEIDAVGDLGHETFAEAESPIAVFEVGGQPDGVATRVGGVVPRAVVVGGPVEELEVGVGSDGVHIKRVRHAELAEAEFEASAREFLEQ